MNKHELLLEQLNVTLLHTICATGRASSCSVWASSSQAMSRAMRLMLICHCQIFGLAHASLRIGIRKFHVSSETLTNYCSTLVVRGEAKSPSRAK